MLSYNQFLEESMDRKQLNILMGDFGYSRPAVGADGHITYTNKEDEDDQILVDVPGNEWHHMVKGKVTFKGSMKDDSLKKYLE